MTSPISFIHPSNALTYVSLCAGLGAIAAALDGNTAAVGALIAAAALADTFDGRFARLFRRSLPRRSPEGAQAVELDAMGRELDSLSDAVAFGAAPVAATSILLAQSSTLTWIWWTAAAIYAACAITRLAFYNISTAESSPGFIGLPAPVAALIWSSVLLLQPTTHVATIVAGITGAAMVAPLCIPRPSGLGLAAFSAWPAVLLLVHVGRM